jgi:hypothetical protein
MPGLGWWNRTGERFHHVISDDEIQNRAKVKRCLDAGAVSR